MTDLEQLRADLAVLERYSVNTNQFSMACAELKSRIAELEAKADPWRAAKNAVEYFRGFAKHRSETDVVKLVDHLTAENERLTKRVAELEAKTEDADDVAEIESLSDEQVDAQLQRRGIDVAQSFQKACEALDNSGSYLPFEGLVYDLDREIIRVAEKAIPLHIRNGGIKVKAVAEYALMLRFDNARLQSELKTVQDELLAIRKHDGPAKPPPVSLKRADETHVGDRILGGGKIRTISQVHGNIETSRVRLWGNGWGVWLESDELVAVVNGAIGEGETCPLKKGCDDGK